MSFICGFDIVNGGKTNKENPFLLSAVGVDVRMRICHQDNGGSNISKREINKLWRECFPNCFAWGAADSNKVSFYLSIV